LLEPIASPGIINNTYKSSLAVGSWVAVNPSGAPTDDISVTNAAHCKTTTLPEGIVNFGRSSLLSGSATVSTGDYDFVRVPFEAMYRPWYLNTNSLSGGFIYDSGVGSASLSGNTGGAYRNNSVAWQGAGDLLYAMAADNFLCETYNLFVDDPVYFISNREDAFSKKVKANENFALTLNVYRTLDKDGLADRSNFELYSRASAFGAPFVLDTGSVVTYAGDAATGNIDLTASEGSGPAHFTTCDRWLLFNDCLWIRRRMRRRQRSII